MPKYLFNAQYTIEVVAPTEEDARDAFYLSGDHLFYTADIDIIDSDVMLVEVDGETPPGAEDEL